MASIGTYLGSATGNLTATITVSSAPEPGELLELVYATKRSGSFYANAPLVSVVDSKGGSYSSGPDVGPIQDGASFVSIIAGSVVRTGPTLAAGDTITATFFDNEDGVTYCAIFCQGINGVSHVAVGQDINGGSAEYSNGDQNESGGSVIWGVDYSGLTPTPTEPCAFVGVFACLDGTSFSPVSTGSVVAQASVSNLIVVMTFAEHVSGLTEPGGSFSEGSLVVGNYQFIKFDDSVTPPPPAADGSVDMNSIRFRAWQGDSGDTVPESVDGLMSLNRMRFRAFQE